MAHPIKGDSNFGEQLAEVLGLDGKLIKGISLRVYAGEIVTVTVAFFPTEDDLEGLKPLLEEYQLTKKIKSNGQQ